MVYVFGECELDEARFELRRRGAVVKLEPKTFDVLAYLARSGDRVVSKDELLDAVWAGQAVSESVLPKCVAAARRAVGDTRARPAVIQTVHGRGYRFIAAVRTQNATAADAGEAATALATPFIGYADVLARLRAAFDAALAGHGRLVLLVGEPGIGKTRCAEELAAEARRRHALVLIGRAHDGDGAPAFWPWVQILRGSAPQRGARAPAIELDQLMPELRGANAVGGSARDAEQARFRLFDAVTGRLRRLAAQQPLVLVLDDLHWADEVSLRLLGFAVRELAETRVLVVATYRDVEVRRGQPLADLLVGLAGVPRCERIALRGLDPTASERFIAAVAGAPPPPAFGAAVHDLTEGNPFFIREMVGWLGATGALAAGQLPQALALPQSVRDAIGRRLDALSDPCNALLRIAAVIGREFDAPRLAAVAALTTTAVLERLADAVRAGVLDEADVPGRYRFHHSLTRQTLYEELSTPERVRLHAQIAAVLTAATAPVLDELAHHLFQAAPGGDHEQSVDVSVRAAERAHALLAYEQSARHYERALQVCELYGPPDPTRRAELLLALGRAHALAGARDRARAAFQRAAQLGRELGRPDVLARAALGDRGAMEMGTPAEDGTRALLDEACQALGDGAPALRAQLLTRMVGTPPHSDSMDTRDRLSREALALAQQAGDGAAMRDAFMARLWACLGPDHLDERLAIARELLALAERERDPHTALLAHEVMIGAHLVRGEMTAADRALDAYTRVAEDMRQPAWLFQATFIAGSRAMAAGELDRAEQLFHAALARGRGTVPYAHFMCVAQLYTLLFMRGDEDDPELSRVFFGEMMALPYSWATAMRGALAFSLCLRGDYEAARREFDALVAAGFDTIRRDEHWLVTMGSLSSVAVLLADRGAASQLYDLLLPYAELIFVHDLLRSVGGTVAAALGSLATLLGRYDDGERHFRRAEAIAVAVGGIGALTDCPGYARLLLQRNGPGDAARAATLLAAVRAEMARLGIRGSWQLLALERLGLERPAAAPAPAPAPAPAGARRPRPNTTKRSGNRQDRKRI